MSLVVAQQWDSMIVVVGDTHLVDPYGDRIGPLQGIVKTRILADHLCISFAGSLYWAEVAFRELDQGAVQDVNTAIEILGRIHRESNQAVDFLVASSKPKPLLTQIKDGGVRTVVVSWLGSARAFARFQAVTSPAPRQGPIGTVSFEMYRLPEGPHAHNEDYAALLHRMRTVIEASDVPEVGGFVIPIGLHKERFEYMDYATVLTHPIRFDLMPTEFVVPFGTAAEGGYGFNLMSGTQGSGSLAVYALQGRCGAVFLSRDGILRPIVFPNVSPVEFEDQTSQQLGIRFGCMFSTPHEFVTRAMERLEASDLDGALREAERAVNRSNKREPEPYRCRAIVYATRGEIELALEDFSSALDLDKTHAPTWDNRGLALARLGRLDEAKSDFSRALEIQPDYARGYRHRAMVARLEGDEHQALSDEAAAHAIETDA